MKENEARGENGQNNHFYHVCTDGMSRSIMFRDDTDYISGMNDIPVCALASGIEIYCFCLMSNHVHFIVKGTETRCLSFIRKYKRLRTIRARNRYESSNSEKSQKITVKRIDDAGYQQSAMAYVMRNPVAAGIQVMPWNYPWSSASLYFSYKPGMDVAGYRKISELKIVEIRTLLKTRIVFPEHYLIREDGLIWPGSYVEYAAAERVFGSPRRLLYLLSKNRDIEHEIDDGIVAKSGYSDMELSVSAELICMEEFKQPHPDRLSIENRYIVARELRRRYGASPKQIARVIGLDANILKTLL